MSPEPEKRSDETLDLAALKQLEMRVGLDGEDKDIHDMLMAFGPLLAALAASRADNERLRGENAELIAEAHSVSNSADDWCAREEAASIALDAARVEVSQLRAKIKKAVNYCNEADHQASRGKIGGVVLPWAGTVRHLLAAAASQPPSIMPELVDRIQYACRQIDEALLDTRVDPAVAAWLRTIRDGLSNASGDVLTEPLGSTPSPPATEDES